jgi:hypothetical protein
MTSLSTWSEAERPPQWDPDLVAHMVEAGCTARAISVVFGLSKNAVLGRLHRDRALNKLWTIEAKRRQPPPRKGKPKPVSVKADWKDWEEREAKRTRQFKPAADDWPEREAKKLQKPHMLLVPILNLGPNQCRWPVEEAVVTGGYLFCGAATSPFESYCDWHKAKARPGGSG